MIAGSPDSVVFEAGGWRLPNGEIVDPKHTRRSMDKDFHWCRYTETSPVIRPPNKPACLYVPGGDA